MRRRDFGKTSLSMIAVAVFADSAKASQSPGTADFPKFPGLTKYVGTFVTETKYQDIPGEVIELGKKSILDGLGLALAGSRAESGAISRQYVEESGVCNGKATIIGATKRTSPRFAALVNGISIHADDFDDTQLAAAKDRVYGLLTHPTVPVLPAIFALAERRVVTGKEWMLAYHVGVEVECKIAEAIAPRHYQDGFHSTGTCGPFGSAAACAKLLRFDLSQILNAFGLAASQSGGLRENFGTMTKPFQAGRAAESGLVSAELVALGWTAAEQILEADRGFFHASGGSYDPSAIMDRLGSPWTFQTPGVSLKPYPSGSLTHPAMTAALRLIEKYNIKPEQIEKIDVGTNHNMPNALIHHRPTTGLQGKFSMEYCIALLALTRTATLSQFTDAYVRRPEVLEMVKRVNFYVEPIAEKAGFDKMTSLVTFHLKDGKTYKDQDDFAKGSPANPMSYEEVIEKFRACAAYATWPKEKSEAIIDFVTHLEQQPDFSKLTAALSSVHA